jgi:PadR family transcriptional regulator, regulatory protein PadR
VGEFEQLVLLALLRLGNDAYGMEARREIEARTGREVSIGALYTALDRLERKGFVAHRVGEPTPERGGRARKHFRVLPAGAAALERARAPLDLMWDGLRPGALPVSGGARG